MLEEITDSGFLKAGFFGTNGSGKTFTATEVAIYVRKHFGLDGPIAFFDTENGARYRRQRIYEATGRNPVGVRARSLDQLVKFVDECQREKVSVAIVDSLTHVWDRLCEDYLAQANAMLKKRGKKPIYKLEFQHWGPIKERWRRWCDAFLNSDLHIIVCARAGNVYEWTVNSMGKREIEQVDEKFKAEYFGYEPSLLVHFEQVLAPVGEGRKDLIQRATVRKDRFDMLNGRHCDMPGPAFFAPHIELLDPTNAVKIDTESQSAFDIDVDGNIDEVRTKIERDALVEEVQGLLMKAYPGQTAAAKSGKAEELERCFGTRSWTKVSKQMSRAELRAGLEKLRQQEQGEVIYDVEPPPPSDEDLTW